MHRAAIVLWLSADRRYQRARRQPSTRSSTIEISRERTSRRTKSCHSCSIATSTPRRKPGWPICALSIPRGAKFPTSSTKLSRNARLIGGACASHVASLKEVEGSLEIIAKLDEKSPSASGFTVRTPLKDFERRVQVFGSNAGQQWQSLVPEALLFDYSRSTWISAVATCRCRKITFGSFASSSKGSPTSRRSRWAS